MQGIEAFPLSWPEGWQRTPVWRRKSSRYKVSFSRARDAVVRSLKRMGVLDHNVVISSNLPLRRDGLPLANMREPDDPGIAVYWTTKDNERRVIACDSWRTTRENLRAVSLTLEALRMLERTGASEILNRAFTGFAALPPAKSEKDWRDVLGITPAMQKITRELIEERYRMLAKEIHPDQGGDHDAMVRLNKAREDARRFLGLG